MKLLLLLTRAGRRGALSSASDGHMVETATQDDLSGLAGTPLDRGRRHGFSLAKTGFALHRFVGADEAADCLSTATHRHRYLPTLRNEAFHRCAPADETAASPAHSSPTERALLPRRRRRCESLFTSQRALHRLRRQTTKPAASPEHISRAASTVAARRPWARKKRKQTMNHLHST